MWSLFPTRRWFLGAALLGGILPAWAAGTTGACFAPSGDWITGADLAAALPSLQGLPGDLKVGYAPTPGLVRLFHPDELRRLALAHGLPDPAPGSTRNLCTAWPLTPLAAETLQKAMERALEGRAPRIEILLRDKAEAPAGEVVFPLSGLSPYADGVVFWKGYVRYSETRRFETWARARVRVNETHLRAQGPIHAGTRMAAGQWRAEPYSGPPMREAILSDSAQIDGLVARRDFAAGALLLAGFFEAPQAVERGDFVTVIAGVGGARIEAPGEALGGGRCGEVILVRNPRSNRTFKARIAAAGRVEVLPGTTVGLAGTDALKGNS